MQSIAQLESEIRGIINSARKQSALLESRSGWYMLCSCLDTIGDTELCIDAFLAEEVDLLDYGARYLRVYGVLQALFVQQDAVCNLTEALKIPYTPDPDLRIIREIRNDSIGHPTKRGRGTGRAFNFITRVSLGSHGFQLMTTYPGSSTPVFRQVDIPDLIARQRSVLADALEDVINTLRREEMTHRQEFADEKLVDAFPPTLLYHIEKIFESIHRPEYAEFGGINVDFVIECIDQFKAGLKKRGILEAYDNVAYTLELVDYPLRELQVYFRDPERTHIDAKDAYIFAYFVREQTENLLEMAKEIDKEYSTAD
jgi:hypothetical protein